MLLNWNTARETNASAEDILRQVFADRIGTGENVSALFTDSERRGL